MTWFGAVAFCNWISEGAGLEPLYKPRNGWRCRGNDPYRAGCYRLPTEAEWEWAARGPEGRDETWGIEGVRLLAYSKPVCNFHEMWTTPVGAYSPISDSQCGASDMMGNVWEWVYDRKSPYTSAALVDPSCPDHGHNRMIRGGGFETGSGFGFMAATRSYSPETNMKPYLGFRVAMTGVHAGS